MFKMEMFKRAKPLFLAMVCLLSLSIGAAFTLGGGQAAAQTSAGITYDITAEWTSPEFDITLPETVNQGESFEAFLSCIINPYDTYSYLEKGVSALNVNSGKGWISMVLMGAEGSFEIDIMYGDGEVHKGVITLTPQP